MTISNSIVNGNTSEDCGGIYCASNWVYVVFSSAIPQPVDSRNITIAFSDSLGNTFSADGRAMARFPRRRVLHPPSALTSQRTFSGLDTTLIGGQGFGTLLVITPASGATLSPLTITNPGQSFLATQTFYAPLLSVNHNVSGQTSTAINLGRLANNGGPTQTMLPLTGSTALCVITPSAATGTDQRGQSRASAYGNTTCQDAGALTNQLLTRFLGSDLSPAPQCHAPEPRRLTNSNLVILFHKPLQPLQPAVPPRGDAFEELVHRLHRLRFVRKQLSRPTSHAAHDPHALQHAQVLGDRLPGQPPSAP